MKTINTDTALVLFSRTPDAEASVKRFVTGQPAKHNNLIAKALYQRALKITCQSNLPFFVISEKRQIGKSFGEKLSNAIESVFQKGFDKVIVVGNDCLQLTAGFINHSAEELNNNDLVIAPTSKGGISLLGITKSSFYKDSFQAIPWQTSTVHSSLISLASSQSMSISHLPLLDDVNNYTDLIVISNHLHFSDKFRLLILSLFAFVKNFDTSFINFSSYHLSYIAGLRAPPSS